MPRAPALTPTQKAAATTVEGVLERVTYANDDNAWSVVKLVVAGKTDLVTAQDSAGSESEAMGDDASSGGLPPRSAAASLRQRMAESYTDDMRESVIVGDRGAYEIAKSALDALFGDAKPGKAIVIDLAKRRA